MSIDITEALKQVLLVAIGAAIPIVGTLLNNHHTRRLQIELWRHEDEKTKSEVERQAKEGELKQQILQRQQIIDFYAKAMYHLSIIAQSKLGPVHTEVLTALKEVQPYLLQIRLQYPNKGLTEYKEFKNDIEKLYNENFPLFKIAESLYLAILRMAEVDLRL